MLRWEVLDIESLSDHFYILFEINPETPSSEPRRGQRIDDKKLEALLKSDHLATTLGRCSAANLCALALTESISKCRNPAGRRQEDPCTGGDRK